MNLKKLHLGTGTGGGTGGLETGYDRKSRRYQKFSGEQREIRRLEINLLFVRVNEE